jgi:hypothetical protein
LEKKKKDYAKPLKEDLYIGNVLPIYGEFTTEEHFRGNALLIKRKKSSWRDENAGYIRAIIECSGEREGYAVMWKHQRWIVKYIDGPLRGHITCANIGYFYANSFLDKGEEE